MEMTQSSIHCFGRVYLLLTCSRSWISKIGYIHMYPRLDVGNSLTQMIDFCIARLESKCEVAVYQYNFRHHTINMH